MIVQVMGHVTMGNAFVQPVGQEKIAPKIDVATQTHVQDMDCAGQMVVCALMVLVDQAVLQSPQTVWTTARAMEPASMVSAHAMPVTLDLAAEWSMVPCPVR